MSTNISQDIGYNSGSAKPDTWYWPVPGSSEVSSGYGPRDGGFHKGIDIRAGNGTPVVATRSGRVITADFGVCSHNYGKPWNSATGSTNDHCNHGWGNQIEIDHGDGFTTRYAHLSDVSVSVGSTVAAGQRIGAVGSTGNSTGFHLHFMISKSGSAVNPRNYVDPSGPTSVSPDYDPSDTPSTSGTSGTSGTSSTSSGTSGNYSSESSYSVPEAGGTTVAQRVAGVTPQPVHPFINIWLGDDKLLATDPARPNLIQSFEIQRIQDGGESASIVIFDNNWEEVEFWLSQFWNDISIEYGHYGTGLKSRRVKHMLSDYSIAFTSTGTILSIKSITQGIYQNLSPTSMSLNTYNPTEAVMKICTNLGYEIKPEYFDASKDIVADNPFNLIEDYPLDYIQRVIIPQAAQYGEEIFVFNIDDEGFPHFKRMSYDSTKTDTMRTYVYQKGYDSSVIDFTVDINGVFGGSGGIGLVSGFKRSAFDTQDKTPSSVEVDIASAVTGATGDITHTHHAQSQRVIDSSGYSTVQSSNMLYYNMKANHGLSGSEAYTGHLTIVGDPTIELYDWIRIINVTDEGYLHHTSGVYQVMEIIDSIQGGNMITSLNLQRNASAGDMNGIELINPKYYIK